MNTTTLNCSDMILFNEKFSREDIKEKRSKNGESSLEAEINIAIAFPKRENSDYVEKSSRFNMKCLIKIRDSKDKEIIIDYLAEYSIKYSVIGKDIDEKAIIENDLLDKEFLFKIIDRAQETFNLAGFKDIKISERVRNDEM